MSIVDLNKPYDYERMLRDVEDMLGRYPRILSRESLGRTLDGRDIPSITIGRSRRCVLLTAGVHGRESVNPAVLMGMAEYYLERFACIPHFRHLSISMIPMVNPDGHTIALKGWDKIRSTELRSSALLKGTDHQEWKYNAGGIDINRNFPCKAWSSLSGTDEPGTEPETKAVMRFLLRRGSIGYIDYHSRGDLIYYYRNRMDVSYNKRQKALALALKRITGYRLAEPAEETDAGDVGGNTVHFYSERTGKPAITIETLPDDTGFPLPYERQRALVDGLRATPFVFSMV